MWKKEMWKPIKNYEGFYEVSNLGNIKCLDKKRGFYEKQQAELRQHLDKGGYYKVILTNNKKSKNMAVQRLVAEAFLDKRQYKSMPDEDRNLIKLDKLEVNHKDENKLNNCANNLEWCTRKYNANYGNRGKRASKSLGKKIMQYTKNGEFVKEWGSIKEATEKLHLYGIGRVCRGKAKSSGGYIWKYKEVK